MKQTEVIKKTTDFISKDLVIAASLNIFDEVSVNDLQKFCNLIAKHYPSYIVMTTPSLQSINDFDRDLFFYKDGKYTKRQKNQIGFLDNYHLLLDQIGNSQLKDAFKEAVVEFEKY